MQRRGRRGLVIVASAVLGVWAIGMFMLRGPNAAPPASVQVERTAERIERGRYLFQNVCDCEGCHSERDFTRFAGPVIPAGRGKGFVFPPELGLPGTVTAPNITSDMETGIGAWTDGEIIRAIREGVGRDGRTLFPMMPYPYYSRLSDEDVHSLVAYLRTLSPIRNALPSTKLNFPVSLFIRSIPKPVGSVPPLDHSNPLARGEYLAVVGACLECHTQEENGKLVQAKRFSGGREFHLPFGTVVSSNITPDRKTGIGSWSEQSFVNQFASYRKYLEGEIPKVGPSTFTLMPWLSLSQLKEEDLRAIYKYLMTVSPVENPVQKHPV